MPFFKFRTEDLGEAIFCPEKLDRLPNWTRTQSYQEYLKSREWAKAKERFKMSKRYKAKCAGCGIRHVPLDIHHMTYAHIGNENPEDLVELCRPCHEAIHECQRHASNISVLKMTQKLLGYLSYAKQCAGKAWKQNFQWAADARSRFIEKFGY